MPGAARAFPPARGRGYGMASARSTLIALRASCCYQPSAANGKKHNQCAVAAQYGMRAGERLIPVSP
jgi:hypothetical protein